MNMYPSKKPSPGKESPFNVFQSWSIYILSGEPLIFSTLLEGDRLSFNEKERKLREEWNKFKGSRITKDLNVLGEQNIKSAFFFSRRLFELDFVDMHV